MKKLFLSALALMLLGLAVWALRQHRLRTVPAPAPALISADASSSVKPPLSGPSENLRVERVVFRVRPAPTSSGWSLVKENQPFVVPAECARFKNWVEHYLSASPSERQAQVAEGIELARARRSAMAGLIAHDPASALANALPPSRAARLPAEIRAQMEVGIAAKGFYGVKAICNHGPEAAHGASCRIEPEAVINGQIYPASIYGSRKERLTEENASLYGIALDGKIALHEDDWVVLPAEDLTADPTRAGQIGIIFNGNTTWAKDETAISATIQNLIHP